MLVEVWQKFGGEIEVVIIVEFDELGLFEGYYSQVLFGFVLVKMIVMVDVLKEIIIVMCEWVLKVKYMESMICWIILYLDDLVVVDNMLVWVISVILMVNFDEVMVIQCFGQLDEWLVFFEKWVYLFYLKKGLDVLVDIDGKELL